MAKHGKKRDDLNYEKNVTFLAAREARPKAVRLSNGQSKIQTKSKIKPPLHTHNAAIAYVTHS